jgi:hypothetical protein
MSGPPLQRTGVTGVWLSTSWSTWCGERHRTFLAVDAIFLVYRPTILSR